MVQELDDYKASIIAKSLHSSVRLSDEIYWTNKNAEDEMIRKICVEWNYLVDDNNHNLVDYPLKYVITCESDIRCGSWTT
eukprot:9414655-Heterocapsa_arctica.AAC.1